MTPPVITQYAELQDIVGQHLSAAAAGTVTPEQALKDMQAECEQKIDLTNVLIRSQTSPLLSLTYR